MTRIDNMHLLGMTALLLGVAGVGAWAMQNPSAAPVAAMRTSEADAFSYRVVNGMKGKSEEVDTAIDDAMADGKLSQGEVSRILRVDREVMRSRERRKLQQTL
jgi:hypothetical protein